MAATTTADRGPAARASVARVGAAAAGLLATTALLGGCQAGRPPALRGQGVMVGGAATQPYVAASRPVTFGSIMVCGSEGSDVTVDDVTLPTATGGLRVSAFAVRPNPATSGGAPVGIAGEPLSSPLIGVDTVGPGVVEPCDPNGAGGSEVLVEVTRLAVEDGCAPDGMDLHYRASDSESGAVLHVPLALGIGAGDAPCS